MLQLYLKMNNNFSFMTFLFDKGHIKICTSNILSLFTSMFTVTGSMIDKAVSSSIPNIHENISQWLKLHDNGFSGTDGRNEITVVL